MNVDRILSVISERTSDTGHPLEIAGPDRVRLRFVDAEMFQGGTN